MRPYAMKLLRQNWRSFALSICMLKLYGVSIAKIGSSLTR